MVKELVSKKNLWKKITIEKLEDRKEFGICLFFCWLLGFGGGSYTIHIGGGVPGWVPC